MPKQRSEGQTVLSLVVIALSPNFTTTSLATLVGELWYSRDWWPSRPSGGRLAVANPL